MPGSQHPDCFSACFDLKFIFFILYFNKNDYPIEITSILALTLWPHLGEVFTCGAVRHAPFLKIKLHRHPYDRILTPIYLIFA